MDETDLVEDEFASPHTSADDEYDSDEPPELKLDLKELKDCASTIASATCTRARRLMRGVYRKIFLLEFDADSEKLVEIERARHSCIARLTRSEERLARATSELAIMRLVKDRMSIPVAKIFHQDLRPDNPIASVLTQLAGVHFDGIGSIQDNGLGPLVHPSFSSQDGKPFKSTLDYLHVLIPEIAVDFAEYEELVETRQHLVEYISSKSDASCFGPPFRLIHNDLDAQNQLFIKPRDCPDRPPILSGVIDFEYAYVGPLYYSYEYPIFIQEDDLSPELYEQNAILRPYFVRALRQSFPKNSPETIAAREVMREKNHLLNNFPRVMEVIKSNASVEIKRNDLHFLLLS
ncbi:hypothetical protein N7540_003340 [Penicillium herquei]|nr:hypothetical protein N7540_003340 [Penicillium herquei]